VPIPSAQETDELETWPPPPTSSSSSSLPTSVRHIVPRRGYVMSCFQWSCRLGKVFENILDLDNQLKSSEEGHTWDKEYDDWQQSRSMDAHVTELVDQLDRWRKNVPEWLLVDTRAHVSPLPHLVVLSAVSQQICSVLISSGIILQSCYYIRDSRESDTPSFSHFCTWTN
jgi:hypothetical protein